MRLQLTGTRNNRVLLLAPSQYVIDDVSTTFGFVMAEDVTTTLEIALLNDDDASVSVSPTNMQGTSRCCQPWPHPRYGAALRAPAPDDGPSI